MELIFLHADTISHKNVCVHVKKMSMVKNGYGHSGDGTLKLTVFGEWTDGKDKQVFYMLIHDHRNKKLVKHFLGVMVKNRCGEVSRGAGVWSRGSKMNRWNEVIFTCWYKFMKAKSWLNYFWVGVVKNGLNLSTVNSQQESTRICKWNL